MPLLPFELERVVEFAMRHHDLLHVTLAELVLLHYLLRGDILWSPSYRFPYLTYHYRFLQYDVYMDDGFAALSVGPMTIATSTLGRWVYLYGPYHDPLVDTVTYGVLAYEPL
jgi:hypothetical protein